MVHRVQRLAHGIGILCLFRNSENDVEVGVHLNLKSVDTIEDSKVFAYIIISYVLSSVRPPDRGEL